MSSRIWFYGVVIDNQDPLNLGRVRVHILTDDITAIKKSYEGFGPADYWTEKDPFVFNSMLPLYVWTVPKVDELVQVYYHEPNNTQFLNQYYIQGPFNRIQNIVQENYNESQKYTDISGVQIIGSKNLRNPNGTYKNPDPDGVFPDPGDVAVLGRGSTDIVLKEDTTLIRAGKYNGELVSDRDPVGNKNRAFIQLSRFRTKTTIGSQVRQADLKVQNLQVNYLVEYEITNPENTFDLFSGTVRLYKLLPNAATTSQNLKVDSNVEQYKFIRASQSFNLLNLQETIAYINNFLQDCNSVTKTKTGTLLFNVLDERFPIYFRPSNNFYQSMQTSTVNQVRSTLTSVFSKIKLNPPDKIGGYGLIYQQGLVGDPIKITPKSFRKIETNALPETYMALGGQHLYLLSQLSQIPGKNKINFSNSLYGIDEQTFALQIEPNTSSAVRGEELLELLNVIVRFLVSHTHGFPGEAPVPITEDGSSVDNLIQQLNEAYSKVLNQYIRLN
jgi:hypothetical protein